MLKLKYKWGLMALLVSSLVIPSTATISASNGNETLSITGDGKTAKLTLKATEDNGNTKQVDNFELTAENVLQIEEDDNVRITNDVDFDKARTIDANDNEKKIDIDDDGNVDFDNYNQGSYRLEVITENGDRKLFAGIVVIGPENKEQTKKVIERTIVEITIDVDCGKGFKERNDKCIPEKPDCKPWQIEKNNKCIPKPPIVCKQGEVKQNGKCIPKPEPEPCKGLYVEESGKCLPHPYPDVCELGQDLDSCQDYDECIADPESCKEVTPTPPTPNILLAPGLTDSDCEEMGMKLSNGQCEPRDDQIVDDEPIPTPDPDPNLIPLPLDSTVEEETEEIQDEEDFEEEEPEEESVESDFEEEESSGSETTEEE
jgi:hypothetical protein